MKTFSESPGSFHSLVKIPVNGGDFLSGDLDVPEGATGLVIFVHGCGSCRQTQRNVSVASVIRDAGIGTLMVDLLTCEEELEDEDNGFHRFNIALLAHRLVCATRWAEKQAATQGLRLGLFGISTGAAAALLAAADLGPEVSTVVSRGGRPDLVSDVLEKIHCPTLLLVGGLDDMVMRLNEEAMEKLTCEKEMRIVPGASHLFEESGKIEQVAWLSTQWFARHLGATPHHCSMG